MKLLEFIFPLRLTEFTKIGFCIFLVSVLNMLGPVHNISGLYYTLSLLIHMTLFYIMILLFLARYNTPESHIFFVISECLTNKLKPFTPQSPDVYLFQSTLYRQKM